MHSFTIYLNDHITTNGHARGGSGISGKGIHMHKGVGFALLLLSHFF